MIGITPIQALELPIDELAMHVLDDLVKERDTVEHNYLYRYESETVRGYDKKPEAIRYIAEAIAWLRSRAMIAHTPLDNRSDSIMVTRVGMDALRSGLANVKASERLQDNIHPLLLRRVRRQFLAGEYATAIFVAMRAVEDRVRKLAGFGDELIGVALMQEAFKTGGPLSDKTAPAGEVRGMMMLFAGTYAVLRNPNGHRDIEHDDVTEASEAVVTASMLMRILDRIESRQPTGDELRKARSKDLVLPPSIKNKAA